ncbi:MAG TPA: S-adenosylmethionine:tRNA ribosyltransferase-isomerase, partial [Acidimicrobiia bacterium]|nr:S-adenosylmethionine:tRNA ribosyltransferase-isomerase [Acidimicrobiia bacterium]
MIATQQSSLNAFDLPDQAEAGTPPERRGLPRDGVRLMTVDARTGEITHLRFSQLGDMLQPGDLLVVNTSATLPASVEATSPAVGGLRVHFSSPLTEQLWTVEPRHPDGVGTRPWADFPGGRVTLEGGASLNLLARDSRSPRLWI